MMIPKMANGIRDFAVTGIVYGVDQGEEVCQCHRGWLGGGQKDRRCRRDERLLLWE